MNIIPVANRILVKPETTNQEHKTESGIIIASLVKETHIRGTVKAVGPDVSIVQPGNVIYYTKHAGTEIKANNQTYLIMNQEDVLAIIQDESCT